MARTEAEELLDTAYAELESIERYFRLMELEIDETEAPMTPTNEEYQWIRKFQAICKSAPSSIWLYAANGTLNIMRNDTDGQRGMLSREAGYDPSYILATARISCDGGDW